MRYTFGVVPALVAWGSMALPGEAGATALLLALTGQFVFDAAAHEFQLVPSWYMRLRTPLTLVAIVSLGTTLAMLQYF
jgi:hypothetical protein